MKDDVGVVLASVGVELRGHCSSQMLQNSGPVIQTSVFSNEFGQLSDDTVTANQCFLQ